MSTKLFIFILSLFTFNFVCFVPRAHSQSEFRTEVDVSYKVNTNGITTVENIITLENLFTDFYATAFTLSLDNINPINILVYEEGQKLSFDVKTVNSKTDIVVSFPDSVVGKGKKRVFTVSYDDLSIAQRTGEVWEIAIPRISSGSTFSSYTLDFSVPDSFGEEAYISPNYEKKEITEGYKVYYFDKNVVSKTGIVAGFGQFQVFNFDLTYHLENPLIKSADVDIALPPDTSLQKVYYTNLDPKPENIKIDLDGNWLATYNLSPRQRVDIKLQGAVQIFAAARPYLTPSDALFNANLQPTDYWQSESYAIKELAKKYKTPKEIYNFVVGYLTYDFDRVKPNISRLGAEEALKNPNSAICMEFTDLFIAIARAAGIAAREINGFAYTENPKIQPLSLVSDILHSWPEYWDKEKNTWISIDPTWGSTTQGVDFFNKLDLRHFAFVIHGQDSIKPYPPGSYKLGPNPQKDVFVSFGKLPVERSEKIHIVSNIERFIPFSSQKILISVINEGVSASNNLDVNVFFDEKLIENQNITVLPPLAKYEFSVKVPFSFLGRSTPHIIKITAKDEVLEVGGAKVEVIIYNLASIFLISLIITLAILIKIGKIKIPKIKKIFSRKSGDIQISEK